MGIVGAWILGGLGVLGGVIVALINLLGGSPTVVVNINSTRQDNSAVSAATSSSAAAKATPSAGTPAVVFRDNFCTTAGGWTLGTGRAGGQYSTCALRIYANGNDVQSSEPANAGSLPQDITIDVTARRILGSAAVTNSASPAVQAKPRDTPSSCKPARCRSTGTPARRGSSGDGLWRTSRPKWT